MSRSTARTHPRRTVPLTKAEFKAEIAEWAARIKVKPAELHIRPMQGKWGSCSTRGRVTLNSELLGAPVELPREVIVEELLHLRVPNHGKLFRALKKAYLDRPIALQEQKPR